MAKWTDGADVNSARMRPSERNQLLAKLEERFYEAVNRLGVPGAVLALLWDGSETFYSAGVTNVELGIPIDPDSIFPLASMSKPLTATVAVKLVDEGLLELDRPIREYLRELRLSSAEARDRLTLRHLLTHSCGWFDDPLMDIDDPETALEQLPQLVPAGTIWSYSTSGYYLVGRLIEAVTDLTFEGAVECLLAEPLRLSRTGLSREMAMTHRVSIGHAPAAEGPTVVRPWPRLKWDSAAQGIYSTPRDLMNFSRVHLDDAAGEYLSAELARLMRSPLVDDGRRGLGWILRYGAGSDAIEHPGGLFGSGHNLVLVPSACFAVLVLSNLGSHALDRELIPWCLENFVGITPPDMPIIERSSRDLRRYEGRYLSPSRAVDVTADSGGLLLQIWRSTAIDSDGVARSSAPPPLRVGFYDGDAFVVREGPHAGETGKFFRDPMHGDDVLLVRFPTFLHVRQPSRISIPRELLSIRDDVGPT